MVNFILCIFYPNKQIPKKRDSYYILKGTAGGSPDALAVTDLSPLERSVKLRAGYPAARRRDC